MEPKRLPLHVRMLQEDLRERQSRNPRFSMRAFAKFLDLDASTLSRVLNGKQDLSLQAAQVVLERLQLSPSQNRLFIASIAEDKRNRANALLTRAVEPALMETADFDPRLETIVDLSEPPSDFDVFNLEDDYISMMNLEGQFIHANDSLAKRLGTIPCNLIGERWPADAFDSQTAALLESQQAEVSTSAKPTAFEFTVGEFEKKRIYRRSLTPVFGRRGDLSAVYSLIRDVTRDRFLLRALETIHSTIEIGEAAQACVRAATPVFADASVLLIDHEGAAIVAAYHAREVETGDFRSAISPFVSKLNSLAERVPESQPMITSLPEELSSEMTYREFFKPDSLIASRFRLDRGATATLFHLSSRVYREPDLEIAGRLASAAASALRNARAASLR